MKLIKLILVMHTQPIRRNVEKRGIRCIEAGLIFVRGYKDL